MNLHAQPTSNHGILLSRALADSQQATGDVRVTSCTSHVAAVRSGDVFVATDQASDPHSAAQQAVAKGASAIVTDQFVPVFGVPQFVVADTQKAYSELCHAILDNPSRELNAIGIAGTHGKTSIAMVLDSILNIAGKEVATSTNQFTRIDGKSARFVSPVSAPAIADFVDEALASGCRRAVVELSEETLQTKAAHAAEFDVVCLSNLHGDRAGSHGSPSASRENMVSALELLSPHGMAILNADCPDSMRVHAELDSPVLTFGLHRPADLTAKIVEQHTNEQMFMLTVGDESAAVRSKIIGETHVQNCLAAAAIAKVYGVSLVDIVRGIERVTVVPGVMHRFDAGLGVPVFVDRGQTPIAKGAALSAARAVTQENVVAVVDKACSVSQTLADRTIATSGLCDDKVITDAVTKVLAAMQVTRTEQLRVITQKLTGIAMAIMVAKPGDVVVVSGLEASQPRDHRASQSVNQVQMIQSLMYELAVNQKKAA